MRVTFQFTGPGIIARISRLRGDKPVSQFLKDCLVDGIATAEKSAKGRGPVSLARTRPEFRTVTAAQIAEALTEANPPHPVRSELARLVRLYTPVLAPEASAVRPAGLLRLDVRCPIEKVAANMAFRVLKGAVARPAVTVH